MTASFERGSSAPFIGRLGLAALLSLLVASHALGQLRVVTYNTHGGTTSTDIIDPLKIVLRAIGEQERNGIARPIDVLLLQEQNSPSSDTQKFVNYLNSVYGAGTYARGFVLGGPFTSDIRQTIVYNTQTIQQWDSGQAATRELAFGTTGGSSNQERQTMRYRLTPVGYDTTADFYAYNSHYKASLDSSPPGTNAGQRNAEAITIRANSDALGDAHAIYAGDHNFYYSDSREPAWGTLTAAGAGQANDPANRVGNWHDSSSFADVHTQSPCATSCTSGFATGGMDDRFDFQLVTGEFLDGEGLSYISGSYHAFGNNGSTFNTNINALTNSVTFPGVTSYTKQQILDALKAGSDHIPVVADYQLPAVMDAVADTVPMTLDLGEVFNLDVTVSNAAPVDFENGVDELDYSLTTSGDLSGEFLNQMDMALGSGNTHSIALDTSTPGMKSGLITISSTSQQVQNGLIEIPISFEVLAPGLEGDYNNDGKVDAADYVLWRTNPNDFGGDPAGYIAWRQNYGAMQMMGSGARAAVPEPGACLLLVLGVCLAALGRGKLKG
jgi:hypothetical protein